MACGRHGCYVPQALVDLFKGEQQKNADFSFIKTLKHAHIEMDQTILLIYDIICQYIVYLLERIGTHLPPGLVIDAAIGLFHVHAHKEQCFFQYAPTFIPGTGIIAGEILESLWSSLNSISPMARTATLANRAEILDDHANDSNYKKTLGIVSNVGRSYRHALGMLDHAKVYHQNLTDEAGKTAVEKWTRDIERAEADRRKDVTVMNIYAANVPKVKSNSQEPRTGMPVRAWMENSLIVEEKQLVLHLIISSLLLMTYRLEIQAKVRHLGRKPGITAQQSIETAREQLTALVHELKRAMDDAGVVEIHSGTRPVQEPLGIWDEIVNEPVPGGPNLFDTSEDPASSHSASTGPIQIENQIMPLPSNGNVSPEYSPLELSHRISRAEHHLNRIRDLIADKSFQYSHVIRVAPRKDVNTRSRTQVKKLNLEISVHCRLYTQCRARLISLGADPDTINRFQVLTSEDVKASTTIVNPNEPGSTQLKLSWIWQSAGGHRWGLATNAQSIGFNAGSGANFNAIECKFIYFYLEFGLIFHIVRRVHWLRARAQLLRWQEEVTITGYEMQWTVRYFQYMSRKWVPPEDPMFSVPGSSTSTGEGTILTAGAIAYWNRKRALWEEVMKKADSIFRRLNPAYDSPL